MTDATNEKPPPVVVQADAATVDHGSISDGIFFGFVGLMIFVLIVNHHDQSAVVENLLMLGVAVSALLLSSCEFAKVLLWMTGSRCDFSAKFLLAVFILCGLMEFAFWLAPPPPRAALDASPAAAIGRA